jgi:mono/diheme cytochrome c family protein
MLSVTEAEWLNPLIDLLQNSQELLLRLLAWSGLAASSHGQPAWPWPWRLSGENLLIDAGQARRLALSLLVIVAVFFAFVLAVFWRRARWSLLAVATVLLIVAPWPDARVVLVPAYPTSFHRSPTGFTASSIERGRALYARHCAECHGDDGRGRGARAAALPVWPPDFASPLLWRRADGDLLWHVLQGMRDRHGALTMPAFAQLTDDAAWSLIDFLKAQGAGQGLRESGAWRQPIALPDAVVRCAGREPRALSGWRGQRLRIVAARDGGPDVIEDLRLVTVLLRPGNGTALRQQAECVLDSSDAWRALELIAGAGQLAGAQLLVDRDGWLRAFSAPGRGGWSQDDLLCRAGATPAAARATPAADGLGALIDRMDAEPVHWLKGGFAH